jgi:putative transposase
LSKSEITRKFVILKITHPTPKMIKAYKFQIKPNAHQRQLLQRWFGCVRFVYNWGLDLKIKHYEKAKEDGYIGNKYLTYNELSNLLTQEKKTEKYLFLNECPRDALSQSLKCLETAYKNFFDGLKKGQNEQKNKYPKFKTKNRSKKVFKLAQKSQFDFSLNMVKIPKLGWVKLRKNRAFDLEKCKVGTLTLTHNGNDKYYISVVVHTEQSCPPKPKVDKKTSIGIDLGIKHYATASRPIFDGSYYYEAPRFFTNFEQRIAALQRVLSRQSKDSNRRRNTQKKLSRLHNKVANCRNNYIHQLTSMLMKSDYGTFVLENLDIKDMLKNILLSKDIQDASWREFRRQMQYKSEWYGKNLVFIGRYDASSQICNNCGYRNQELTLSMRAWKCPKCGHSHDRDINAALNIVDIYFKRINVGREADRQEAPHRKVC